MARVISSASASALRAMQAADEAEDPLVLGSATRWHPRALLAVSRFNDAVELGEVAARWLFDEDGRQRPGDVELVWNALSPHGRGSGRRLRGASVMIAAFSRRRAPLDVLR